MTDTTTLAPTDAEILDAAEDFRSQYTHGGTTFDALDEIGFARAVLARWGTPAPASGEPAAYRLKDDEATKHYGKDVYVYYSPNEFKTPAAFKYLEPLYTARVLLDRIARALLLDVKNRVNALVLLPSSERRESEIRIKQDIADFLAAPPVQEVRVPLSDAEALAIVRSVPALVTAEEEWLWAIREVEKYHGITAAQKETP